MKERQEMKEQKDAFERSLTGTELELAFKDIDSNSNQDNNNNTHEIDSEKK